MIFSLHSQVLCNLGSQEIANFVLLCTYRASVLADLLTCVDGTLSNAKFDFNRKKITLVHHLNSRELWSKHYTEKIATKLVFVRAYLELQV